MTQRFLLLALVCCFCFCHPASRKLLNRSVNVHLDAPEFDRKANGYIYSEAAMRRLHEIVDSLNLRFKSCDAHPRIQALDQATGHYLSGGRPNKLLIAALRENKSLEEVLALSPGTEPLKDLLIIRQQSHGYDGEPEVSFFSPYFIRNGDEYHRKLTQKPTPENMGAIPGGHWIFNLEEDSWEGFYLTSGFKPAMLPEEYGRMAQYVDCLIDTNAQILLEKGGWREYYSFNKSYTPTIDAFVNRTGSYPAWPFPKDSIVWPGEPGYPMYKAALDNWEEQNSRWLCDTFSQTTEFTGLLKKALSEAEKLKASGDEFEEALVRSGYATKALELKRKRRIIGGCSQDTRPREHAKAIAQLAAETVQWDIFLRAHLDIMNDRFRRVSDGTYAWGKRETYISEVEALGINTLDLLIGICLQARDLPQNHYFGSIGRVGRALAEYNRPEELEDRLAVMIADPRLDDYNRLWMYNLFYVYTDYLPEDSAQKTASTVRLKTVGKTLPGYLAEKL